MESGLIAAARGAVGCRNPTHALANRRRRDDLRGVSRASAFDLPARHLEAVGTHVRPRAGHGWTSRKLRGRWVPVTWSPVRESYITTGEAKGWPRCTRCRKPEEPELVRNGLCNLCYYFHSLPKGTFWDHREEWYFPYNIGRRSMERLAQRWDASS